MKRVLIILRGLPGSRLRTVATLFGHVPHFTNDQIFAEDDDKLDLNKITEGRNLCRHNTMDAMREGHPLIVVSNEFVKAQEMETYYLMAQELGYHVVPLVVENRHEGSIGDLPIWQYELMKEQFEIKL